MKHLSKIATTTLGLSFAISSWAHAQTPSASTLGTVSKKFSVVIDAGHGGTDTGDNEKEITLSLAFQLRSELEKRGMRVVLTRSKDEFLPLQARVDVADAIKPDCFVSLHGQREKGHPFSYILNYYNPSSVLLAKMLNKDLTNALNPTIKGHSASARYYVLRKTEVPSVMVTGNIDTLSNTGAQSRFVLALAQGIEDYAQPKKSPTANAPILKDIPNLGKYFKAPSAPTKAPNSTAPASPLLRKPPGNFNYLSAKSGK